VLLVDAVRAMAWAELQRLDGLVASIVARHDQGEGDCCPNRENMH